MKSLLDIQKDVRELETLMHDAAEALECIHKDLQDIRDSDNDMEMDYDMIRTLAKNCPFENHPLSCLEDAYACKVYIELLLCVMRTDISNFAEKMTYIQWILDESNLDMNLEDAYAESLELKDEIFSETALFNKEYKSFLVVDALVISNFVGSANAEAERYIANLCSLMGMDKARVEVCSILAKIALYQDTEAVSKKELKMAGPVIDKYRYCIGGKQLEGVYKLQRTIAVEVYDGDLIFGSLKWLVGDGSIVDEGDRIARYPSKLGSTTNVRAKKSGMLFQFDIHNSSSDTHIGCIGVIAHPSDSREEIVLWLQNMRRNKSKTFR